ncbi:MAG: hypothetical protein UU82_C0027G0001, partial [Candidatus Nomurabacteria bacterium GW2011_GWC2_41_8]
EMLEKHISQNNSETEQAAEAIDDRTKEETQKDDTDLYNISNFSV